MIRNVHMLDDRVSFEYKDIAIGGKLVIGSARFSDSELMQLKADERELIRKKLVENLVEDIMSKQLCEFTQQKDPINHETVVRIRAYLAKDSDVKLLRTIVKD